jgi:hypothetical protein
MTINFAATATKTLLISFATLAIALAGPAAAKDQTHHARSVPVSNGPPGKASGTPVSEPTYMAIQTKWWEQSN